MPVNQNERPEQGHAENDDRGERYRPARHGSLKSELSPTGCPGKWQYRLEGAQGKEEQNPDIPIAQLEVHGSAPIRSDTGTNVLTRANCGFALICILSAAYRETTTPMPKESAKTF